MTAHHHPTEARPLDRPSREEVQAAIETLLCAGLDRDTRAVVRDIEEKLARKDNDTDSR